MFSKVRAKKAVTTTSGTEVTKSSWRPKRKAATFHGKKIEVAPVETKPTEVKYRKFKSHIPHIPLEKLSLHDEPRTKTLDPEERFDLQVSNLEYIRFLKLDGERLKRAVAAMPLKTVQEVIKTYHQYKAAETSLMTNLEQEPQSSLTGDFVPSIGFTGRYECKPCTSEYGW